MYSTVTFALILDLADPHDPDFARIVHVGTTTGLIVDVFNADSANIAHSSGRLH